MGTGPFTMAMEPKHLQLDAVIGFEGTVQNGLIFHPDGQHLIYPLGSTVVIRDLSTSHSQRFLHGHVDKVSTVTLSPCGRYLAAGQVTHMGFTAPILVWDFETGAILHKLELTRCWCRRWHSRAKTIKAAYSWHQLAARMIVILSFGAATIFECGLSIFRNSKFGQLTATLDSCVAYSLAAQSTTTTKRCTQALLPVMFFRLDLHGA